MTRRYRLLARLGLVEPLVRLQRRVDRAALGDRRVPPLEPSRRVPERRAA